MTEIKQLESRLTVPMPRENRVVIEVDGNARVYVGRINECYIQNGGVYCSATLTAFKLKSESKKKIIRRGLRLEQVLVPGNHFVVDWNSIVNDNLCSGYAVTPNGELCKGEGSYRRAIEEALTYKWIVVTQKLMDKVFDPLDEPLLAFFKDYMQKRGPK